MEIEFYQDASGEWRWRVTATNGEIVGASSEGFSSERAARRNMTVLARAIAEFADVTDQIEGILD